MLCTRCHERVATVHITTTQEDGSHANGHIFARNGKELICASLAADP